MYLYLPIKLNDKFIIQKFGLLINFDGLKYDITIQFENCPNVYMLAVKTETGHELILREPYFKTYPDIGLKDKFTNTAAYSKLSEKRKIKILLRRLELKWMQNTFSQ
jgi:hypothetical protein